MHYNYLRLIALLLSMTLFSCDSFDKEEPIPAYITIESFSLEHELALGITDVWVYADGKMVGVFELPAKFPVLELGTKEISISAGIKVNGISATRSYYPFYTPYETEITFEPTKYYSFQPSAKYHDWVDFVFEEDFEGGGITLETLDDSDTTIIISDQERFGGNLGGTVFLDDQRNFFAAICIDELTRPDFTGTPGIFWEMNYKGDNEIRTGIFINDKSETYLDLVILNPTNEWKKVYIDLYQLLSPYPEGTVYKIFISSSLAEGEMSGNISFDDLKVVQAK